MYAAFSIIVAVLLSAAAVGLMTLLVTNDFFLSKFLPLARKLPPTIVWAAAWVLAVMATVLGFVVFLFHRVIPRITSPSPQLHLIGVVDPISIWHQLTVPAKIAVTILFMMSGWSIGVIIDRWLAYSVARRQSHTFAPAIAIALRDGRIDEAIKVAERNKKSHLAKVVTAGLMEFKAQQDNPGAIPSETIEASKRALERTEAIVHAELKRGLSSLATIGSIAPLVGLFGTVMGILNAFSGISEQKATGLGAVAGGISEAPVTTAFGLLVAIPAVMMFNYLTGRLEAFDVEMDNSSKELINDFLIKRLNYGAQYRNR
jgi:biopolymer transport protein ExbB